MSDIGYYGNRGGGDYETSRGGHDNSNGGLSSATSSFYVFNNKNRSGHKLHDYNYYGLCLTGGVLSSSIRWVLTPLDGAKCLMQVHPTKFPTVSSALGTLYQQGTLYRGLVPTILSYGTQTGTKYMIYEYLKKNLTAKIDNGERDTVLYRNAIYIVSAGCAEAIADVLMCPWEMLKVKVQTSTTTLTSSNKNKSSSILQSMIKHRHELGFPFGSLGPLWSRQIIGTIFNFLTFENCVSKIYVDVLQSPKTECSASTQLLVTMIAGYTSGVVSTIVSHPFDSIISYKARYPNKTAREIVSEVGIQKLSTQGLAPRIVLTGSIIGCQWLIYDGFKSAMGMGTTGGH